MAGPVIQLATTPEAARFNHQNRIYSPASCGGQAEKVANLRRLIAEQEKAVAGLLGEMSGHRWTNARYLVASTVKTLCTGFLDLVAAVAPEGTPIKKWAQVGVAGIEAAEVARDYVAGDIGGAEASVRLAKTAVDGAVGYSQTKNLGIKAGALTLGTAVNGSVVAGTLGGKQGSGTDALKLAISTTFSQGELLAEAANSAAMGGALSTVRVQAIKIIEVVDVANNYSEADQTISEVERGIRATHAALMRTLTERLNKALSDLEACAAAQPVEVRLR